MSAKYVKTIQIRWADIDANRHLRHSAYYDYGATLRMMILSENGLTTEKLEQLQIGPVLFREEAIFRREIRLEDVITVDVELLKATPDYSRWSIRHNFLKADGSLAAVINIDAAWIDMVKRKLTVPDEFIQNIFANFPKPDDFEFIVKKT
ncbi:acyl-CoA thioester hydrolase [Chryseolinea serpens]|uniref:Acyl-CoA thioester hydrolase n=1 Tax=Chryseolinea serpens TaxID=947013 RepID=A0A1M5P9K5_9BACT|nr:acyl-CoA thioesterase [Chryseolinea serpens]SHG98458.1 acyl-CoA thioester hydrolase [Chryseolinea serpens]